MQPAFESSTPPVQEVVYYPGTDKLEVGYVLCYDVSATVGNPGAARTYFGAQVAKPATANLSFPAGVVMAARQGPCEVPIAPFAKNKGRVMNVYHKVNATAFTTLLAPQDASYGLGSHSDSGVNLPLVGVALETANTSVTAADKYMVIR